MAVGFMAKPSKAQSGRALDRTIARYVELGRRTFPARMMQRFGLLLDSEQFGPSEDYGVPFVGNKHFSREQYAQLPHASRAAVCFDDLWDFINPDLTTIEVLDMIKGFVLAAQELCCEAMDSTDEEVWDPDGLPYPATPAALQDMMSDYAMAATDDGRRNVFKRYINAFNAEMMSAFCFAGADEEGIVIERYRHARKEAMDSIENQELLKAIFDNFAKTYE